MGGGIGGGIGGGMGGGFGIGGDMPDAKIEVDTPKLDLGSWPGLFYTSHS